VSPAKIPICMLLHPVGIGGTRSMNVFSAKLWLRALVDLIQDVSFCAAWLSYADVAVDRDRGLRDAMVLVEHCDAVVAVGGEFSRGMLAEWEHASKKKLALLDLTRAPLPGILTAETFAETRTGAFRQAVTEVFRGVGARAAA
jgi:hypothetical protein